MVRSLDDRGGGEDVLLHGVDVGLDVRDVEDAGRLVGRAGAADASGVDAERGDHAEVLLEADATDPSATGAAVAAAAALPMPA